MLGLLHDANPETKQLSETLNSISWHPVLGLIGCTDHGIWLVREDAKLQCIVPTFSAGVSQLYADHKTGSVYAQYGDFWFQILVDPKYEGPRCATPPFLLTPRTVQWNNTHFGKGTAHGDTLEPTAGTDARFTNVVSASLDSKDQDNLFVVDQVNDAIYHINAQNIVTPLWRQVKSNPLSVVVNFPDMYILRDGGRTIQRETLISGPAVVGACLPFVLPVSSIVAEYAFGKSVPIGLPFSYWSKLKLI